MLGVPNTVDEYILSAVLFLTADGYWFLYIGSILQGLAAGTVEAVINPAIASAYTKRKTTMLTILHAGWPAGMNRFKSCEA